ncbi:radial spoke head 14 homolog isoform X2 [Scleropages formosus]|uniref:radial spoke head 14 homolog isoform X2 n=1 Tax=Scleropages formosus TaxID=113540 RepID=UPI00087881C4|nr:radial spoke head 14 homolog isoform X2 [Scleropages formosus]
MTSARISMELPPCIDSSRAPLAFGTRALPQLTEQLDDPEPVTRRRVLAALCDLVHDPEKAFEAISSGCLEKLKALLQDADNTVRVKTTEVLYLLAAYNLGRGAVLKHDVVALLSDMLDEPVDACRKNVHRVLELLAQFPAGADCVLSLGLVPRLVMKLSEEQEEIQALILATLSSCTWVDALPALASNGVSVLRDLLSHPSSNIRCAATRAMVAISVPAEGKLKVCNEDVLPVLVELLSDSDPGVKANAAGTIMNTAIITKALVDSEDTAVCANALRALTTLAEVPSARLELLKHVSLLETHLDHPTSIISRAAATAVRVITWQP